LKIVGAAAARAQLVPARPSVGQLSGARRQAVELGAELDDLGLDLGAARGAFVETLQLPLGDPQFGAQLAFRVAQRLAMGAESLLERLVAAAQPLESLALGLGRL